EQSPGRSSARRCCRRRWPGRGTISSTSAWRPRPASPFMAPAPPTHTPPGLGVYAAIPPSGPTAVDGRFEDAVGGLAYRVALRPDAAGRLIIGGLPESRLPVLLGVSAPPAGLPGCRLL